MESCCLAAAVTSDRVTDIDILSDSLIYWAVGDGPYWAFLSLTEPLIEIA